GCGPLDDLAGGDLVDEGVGQLLDAHRRNDNRRPRGSGGQEQGLLPRIKADQSRSKPKPTWRKARATRTPANGGVPIKICFIRFDPCKSVAKNASPGS